MAELAWTDKKPTVPGVYVYRKVPSSLGATTRIEQDECGLYREIWRGGKSFEKRYRESWVKALWYGPLPETKGRRR